MKKQQATHWKSLTPQLKKNNLFFDRLARKTSYLEDKSQLWRHKINQQP
ncbi:hypothetical protein [Gloeocapsopsis dulcis]|nr:hypothetical protein [Gloeocapsopsis dulcis]WNN88079.1 hypothetical protein P0S91_17480 [Gloeocapsopsis dulcis]